jgi:hypothetical protein
MTRDRDLESRLCDVHRNPGIVLHDGLLLLVKRPGDSGTSIPIESWEESISSLQRTTPGFAWSVAAELIGWDHQGNPPPPSPVTGEVPTARTDKEAMGASLAELRRYNVVRAVAGGRSEHVSRWHAADPERIIGGIMMPLPDVGVLT